VTVVIAGTRRPVRNRGKLRKLQHQNRQCGAPASAEISSDMREDDTFRIVLLAGMLIVLPIAAYYRVRSQRTGERLDRRQEGLFILVTLRPLGLAMMAGLIAYIVSPRAMAWSSVALPLWLRWTGVALGTIAGTLLIWTMRSLGKNLTDTVVTRKEHTLVTAGPYRWVRHPFYVAVALAMLANALVAANWFLFVAGALAVALLAIRTAKEEANLLARFGDRYASYMQRTGRFVPRLSRGSSR
jgi:protein-S-isoprenylcysteine O-methyltransferase Ste14